MNRDYTIVIPTYNSEEHVRNLLEDIIEQKDLYQPSSVLIVDDCSLDDTKYLPKIYDTSDLTIDYHRLKSHSGPLAAEKAGIERVDTTMFVVIHADVRLGLIKNKRAEHPIDKIVCYLVKSVEMREPTTGVIAPWTLQTPKAARVQGGPRGLETNKIPFSMYYDYRFASVANIKYTRFESVHSIDSYCYAMLTSAYHECGGIDEDFSPYYFYHDDLFGKVREEGYKIFCSSEVVVFHPSVPSHKDESFLSVANGELMERNSRLFIEKWKEKFHVWQREAILLGDVSTKFFGGVIR